MTEQNPVTHARLKLAPLSHHFPVIFNNGVVVRDLVMACTKCQSFFSNQSQVCGSVTKLGPTEYLIEGAGHCEACNQTSIFDFKIFDDRTIANLVEGEWKTVGPESRKEITPENTENLMPSAQDAPIPRPARQDEVMAKLGTAVMALRLVWIGGYIWSIMPALQEIQSGSKETFLSTFLTNGALIAVGYVCSVMLAVNYFRKK